MSYTSPWLWQPVPDATKSPLMVIIPCAGSAAQTYRALARALSERFDVAIVQRPGRMERRQEKAITAMQDLLAPLAQAVNGLAGGRPVLLGGHSLGALIAYELAAGQHIPALAGIVAMAMAAPSALTPVTHSYKTMDDREFAAYMATNYHGIPERLLAEPALLSLFLPALRADMVMFEDYRPESIKKLSIPILALSGGEDDLAPAASMRPWAEVAGAGFNHEIIAGDHFFPTKSPAEVAGIIKKFAAVT